MTLITYPTRVHFADDVLEEALHSELEQNNPSGVLVTVEEGVADAEFVDRIAAGVPHRCQVIHQTLTHGSNLCDAAAAIRRTPQMDKVDSIVAFGSARAIALGRKMRSKLSAWHGTQAQFIAVPGIDGLPDPLPGKLESWRSGLPSVLICDPTLILSADSKAALRATIKSLVRCIEGYLGTAYNPPANGIALDGFDRSIRLLAQIQSDGHLELRRELMAASLNAAMAQEKGVGPTQSLSAFLAAENADADPADIARLILPGILEATIDGNKRAVTLKRVLGPKPDGLVGSLRKLLADLPLASRLADMGLAHDRLRKAAHDLARNNSAMEPMALAVLESVY